VSTGRHCEASEARHYLDIIFLCLESERRTRLRRAGSFGSFRSLRSERRRQEGYR